MKFDEKFYFELIFNDITNNILLPSQREFILNSAKYIHDFKNHLIAINEEIKDMKEEIDNKNSELNRENNTKKIDFVLQMSEYCMTMIGSYEFLSRNIFNKEKSILNIEKIDIRKSIEIVEKIVITKLKKDNKFDYIDLQIIYPEENFFFLYSDPLKIQQILINLLSNSEKFTLLGKISLEISRIKKKSKEYMKFLIRDTGVGMDSKTLGNLFTPFFIVNSKNENPNGCGLGLIIAKKLTKELGLPLRINSVKDEGSVFYFYVEKKRKEKLISETKIFSKSVSKKKRILLKT